MKWSSVEECSIINDSIDSLMAETHSLSDVSSIHSHKHSDMFWSVSSLFPVLPISATQICTELITPIPPSPTKSLYIFSNWSTLLLVLPFLTSLRVLYLSLPCFTFSLWILSMVVSAWKYHKWTIEDLNHVLAYLVVPGVGQVLFKASQLGLQPLILLCQSNALLE